jgi:cytosine/adenosine deaminase-related metal-dependent hydrolase
MSRTIVRASWVLAYDEVTGDHVLVDDGEVVIEGGTIERAGRRAPDTAERADHVVELGRSVVLPGLIDLVAIADIDHALLDSWSSPTDSLGFEWSASYATAPRPVFDADERRVIRRYALTQLALNGVTTCMPIAGEMHSGWAETFEDWVALAEEAEAVGIRVIGGPSYRSAVNTVDRSGRRVLHEEPDRGEAGFADALRFLDWSEAHASELVTGALLPCRIETLDDRLLDATAAIVAHRGVLVRLHALQGLSERAFVAERTGMTPLLLLERHGLLSPGLLIPHCVVLSESPRVRAFDAEHGLDPRSHGRPDVEVLGAAGVTTVHCPLTSARYATALSDLHRFADAGVRIALGTDSFPPDLIRGIDTGMNVAKVLHGRNDAAPLRDYIRAATVGGADAIRRQDLGRLQTGSAADLVAFGLDNPRDGVVDDPIRTLIMNGTARTARFSMVAGRVVMSEGRLTGVDADAVVTQAQPLFDRMRAAYGERNAFGRTADELFPPVFTRR